MTESEARAVAMPEGVTALVPGEGGLTVGAVDWGSVEPRLTRSPEAFAERLAEAGPGGVALGLGAMSAPTDARTGAVLRFADELQARGTAVVVYAAPADFLTALHFDDGQYRLETRADLVAAVEALRTHDALRRCCASERGTRLAQLRMPAVPGSLAPMCVWARGRLERGGVREETLFALLRETHAALVSVLRDAYEPGEGWLALSVTVHDGRATLTLLDGGRERENEIVCPGEGAAVDRRHRFRIPGGHNALVLEKDLRGTPRRAGAVAEA